MTRHLNTARACVIASTLALLAGCYAAALGLPWLLVPALYGALIFGWCAACAHSNHRRAIAEHDWARRHAAGEQPGPLVPCCRLADTSGGTCHDHRCTDLRTRKGHHA